MRSNVVKFRTTASQIAHFIRVDSAYRRLGDLLQHAAHQALSPMKALSQVPDLNREDFFLEKPLQNAERIARNIKDLNPSLKEAVKLKVNLASLKDRMTKHHRNLGKFSDALSLLHDERGESGPRARACDLRGDRYRYSSKGRPS